MPGRCCTSAGCCGVSTRKAFSRGTWRVHWEASSSAAGLHLHHACSCSTCIRRVPDNVQQCATMCDDVRPCTTMRSKKQQNSQCCRATNLECVEESPAFFAPLAHQAEVEACNEELSVEKLLRAGCRRRGWKACGSGLFDTLAAAGGSAILYARKLCPFPFATASRPSSRRPRGLSRRPRASSRRPSGPDLGAPVLRMGDTMVTSTRLLDGPS